jgi:hypothetical protein
LRVKRAGVVKIGARELLCTYGYRISYWRKLHMEYGKKLTNPYVQVVLKQTQVHPSALFKTSNLLLGRTAVNLDDLIIAWFCLIDDVLPLAVGNKRLRTSGPMPT